jgi:hypothetical protein
MWAQQTPAKPLSGNGARPVEGVTELEVVVEDRRHLAMHLAAVGGVGCSDEEIAVEDGSAQDPDVVVIDRTWSR